MVGTVISVKDAMLLFQKWSIASAVVTCAFHSAPGGGGGVEIQVFGKIKYPGPGVVRMHTLDDAACIRVPVDSVYAYRYCEPHEIATDGGHDFAGFLLVILGDGSFLRFGELVMKDVIAQGLVN